MLVLVLLFVLVPFAALAQFQAAIQGTVTDSSGGVVPNASVTLTNNETKQTQTTTTSADGLYRFNGLAPGAYNVEATAPGFQGQTVQNVAVAAEAAVGANITLSAGSVNQSVTVSADTMPALQTENADLGTNISAREVVELPEYGRDPYSLLRTTPGIIGDAARGGNGGAVNLVNTTGPGGSNSSIFQTENQVPISANGQRISQNNCDIDGVSVNSLTWGGAAVITPNQESVKEIRATASSYSAQSGRNSGAQVNVISQNGTDTIHGSGVFKYNDPNFDAYNKFGGIGLPAVRVDQYLRQFAGSLGGPIIKNKLFWFFSYEGLRSSLTSYSNQYVETPQYDQFILSQRPGSIAAKIVGAAGSQPRIVGTSATPCPPGLTPCQAVSGGLDLGSPVGGIGVYTTTGGGGLDGIPDVMYAQIANPSTTNGNQYNGRMDYTHNNDTVMGSVYLTALNNLTGDSQGRPNQDIPFKPVNELVTLNWNHIISPTILNQARANFTRFADNGVTDSPNTAWGLPRIGIQDYNQLGAQITWDPAWGTTSPGIFAENTYEARDYVSIVKGKHSMTTGIEYRWEQDNNNLLGGARPLYNVSGLWNFADDAPIYEQINGNPNTGAPADAQRYYRTHDAAFFFQDDIRLRSNLTLNIGVRWEYFSPLTEKGGLLTNIFYGSEGLANAAVEPVLNLYQGDWNNWAPRFGLAYSPTSKLVVRTGFGIYDERVPLAILANNSGNPPYFATYNLCCGTASTSFGHPYANGQILYALGSQLNNPGSYPANPVLATGVNQYNAPNVGATQVYGTQSTLPNAYAYIYSFDLQYQLPKSLVIDLGYQGSADRKLIRLVNENFLHPGNGSNFFAVYIPQADSDSNFNALLVTLSKRLSHGLTFTANYRFSKSLDNLSYEGPGFVTNQTYPQDNHSEYGPSDFDVRHNFVGSAVWEVPLVRRSATGWTKEVLGGWTISPIYTWHTGFPWTPVSGFGEPTPSGLTLGPSRPTAYLGGAGESDSNSTFLSTNGNFPGGGPKYFIYQEVGPPGIGRNAFRGPTYRDWDFSLAKSTKLPSLHLGEAAQFEIRANLYNIFNQLNLAPFNFDSPSTTIDNSQFGRATTGLAGRVVEFQGRLSF